MIKEEASFYSHFAELRQRVIFVFLFFIAAFLFVYIYPSPFYNFITEPLMSSTTASRLIYTSLAEGFLSHVKLAFYFSCLGVVPVIIYQIYAFVAPGLYKTEKKLVKPMLLLAPSLFFLGVLFAYYLVVPLAWQFFSSYEGILSNPTMPLELEAKLADYVKLVMQVLIAFGVCFQLPLLILLLVHLNVFTPQFLLSKYKIVLIITLIVSALLTPPDPISQILLASMMMVFYFSSIYGAKLLPKK